MALKSWKEIEKGAVIRGATSIEFKTGNWRTFKPVYHEETCIHCLFCWIQCPDNAIEVEEGKMKGIDYDFCKGCGICANVCPKPGTLVMEREAK